MARGGVLEGASIRSFTKLKMESQQPWEEEWGKGDRFEPQATTFLYQYFHSVIDEDKHQLSK